MTRVSRHVYAGHLVRDLRRRLAINQAAMALRLDLSVSYLSQIENGDRPLTPAVQVALARAFPVDWPAIHPQDETTRMVDLIEAATDPTVPDGRMNEADAQRAFRQQPLLAERLSAVHAAFQRSQQQLRMLDDTVEAGAVEVGRMPWEEVRDWFHTHNNYIDRLDRAAEGMSRDATLDFTLDVLTRRLRDSFGVRVEEFRGASGALRVFDADSRVFRVDSAQSVETNRFSIAHLLARLEFADEIADVVAGSGIVSDAGRQLLEAGLSNYAAGALLMPYGRFRAAARETRHDIDRLRQLFGVSFEQACHRLSNLQRPGALGIPFFFCRVDMAGNITKRHSATRLQFARFGGACPLWIVHDAVAIPDRILVQLAETPDGKRYVSMAKGLVKPSGSFARTPRRYAVALGCEDMYAADFIYADGMRTDGAATPIGISCRICPRDDCDQRAFPPAAATLSINPDRRGVVPYVFS